MKKFLTKRNIIIAAVVAVVVVGWRIKAAAAQKAATVAKEVTVTRQDIQSLLTVSGKIVSDREARLTFPVPGKLAYVGAVEGGSVAMGKALLSLDTGDLAAAEQAAYYRYLSADANAKQIEDSVKGHDSDETFAQKNTRVAAQTARDMAYDAWLTARRALNNATLYAPFAGVVTNLSTNVVGDTVGVTDGVTVVDPTSLHFEGEVDESDIGKVSEGLPVVLSLDAFPNQKINGKVKTIGYTTRISSTGATVFPVTVEVTDEIQKKFRLGMNGDADIILGTAKNVLTLPIEAIIDGKVTLPDGQTKPVQTGLEGITELEITSGLNEGDKVVIK